MSEGHIDSKQKETCVSLTRLTSPTLIKKKKKKTYLNKGIVLDGFVLCVSV